MSQELIEHQTVTAIVENVEQAKLEVKQAFELLRTAKARLNAALGNGATGVYHQIVPNGHYYGDNVFEERALAESHDLITQNAWRYILAQTGLRHYMTERRQKELDEQIRNKQLPEFTVENIFGTLQGLSGRVEDLLLESIKEVFDWLRPHASSWGLGALKTNKEWKIGARVIAYGAERGIRGGFRIAYNYQTHYVALGNVFSLLDGRGVLQYPNDFCTRFNTAMDQAGAGEKFIDDYFECKCFRNSHIHIKFRRPDLVDKLNKIGGGTDLPGKEKGTT